MYTKRKRLKVILNFNITSFFRFVNKRAIYRICIISLAHAPVHVTDFPVVNVHVDELSSVRIWQRKLCATYSANININNRLSIKVYYRICTLRHIRIEIHILAFMIYFLNMNIVNSLGNTLKIYFNQYSKHLIGKNIFVTMFHIINNN